MTTTKFVKDYSYAALDRQIAMMKKAFPELWAVALEANEGDEDDAILMIRHVVAKMTQEGHKPKD